MTSSSGNRRADARRSRAAILDAAFDVLNADPDAGLGTVAKAAGVTRQTVYAHFATREQLLWADDLTRVLEAAAAPARRHPVLTRLISALPTEPDAGRERHDPIAARLAGQWPRADPDPPGHAVEQCPPRPGDSPASGLRRGHPPAQPRPLPVGQIPASCCARQRSLLFVNLVAAQRIQQEAPSFNTT